MRIRSRGKVLLGRLLEQAKLPRRPLPARPRRGEEDVVDHLIREGLAEEGEVVFGLGQKGLVAAGAAAEDVALLLEERVEGVAAELTIHDKPHLDLPVLHQRD